MACRWSRRFSEAALRSGGLLLRGSPWPGAAGAAIGAGPAAAGPVAAACASGSALPSAPWLQRADRGLRSTRLVHSPAAVAAGVAAASGGSGDGTCGARTWWLVSAGAAAGFGGALLASEWARGPVACEAQHAKHGGPLGDGGDDVTRLDRLRTWLQMRGADIGLVALAPSKAGIGAGYGMFVASDANAGQLKRCKLRAGKRWWWPFGGGASSGLANQVPLAQFPMKLALTAHNIVHDPSLGRGYAWMLEHGVADERTVVMAYLVVERLKGAASSLAPWISTLPQTFDTPILYSKDELSELAGTPLAGAARTVAGRLQQQWSRMRPALSSLLSSQSGVTREATFDDLVWAHNVFWSRAHSLPVPRSGAASSTLANDPHARENALLDVHEGIVPGLDFCNHHERTPTCWWEVVTPAGEAGVSKSDDAVIQLRLHPGAGATPGSELCISYGEKPNEELLMLCGFAVHDNPHDCLMLHVPLPPSSAWDEVMHARVALIRECNLELQFFLPSHSRSSSARPCLPNSLLQTLEVFVLTPSELAHRLEVVQRLQHGNSADGDAELLQPVDVQAIKQSSRNMGAKALADASMRLGVRLGALAAAVKMMEARVQDQEGEQGSGTMEQDKELLKDMQNMDTTKMSTSQRRRYACVVYRYEQKRIAREYLKIARSELQEVLSLLNELGEQSKKAVAAADTRAK